MNTLPVYTRVDHATQSFPPVRELFMVASLGLQRVINGDITAAEFYKETNPFATSILFSVILSVFTLILSEITRNFSQVDRLWSILPAAYVCHYAYWSRINDLQCDRLDTAAVISIAWSLRLTFNYWRKGGYKWSTEDYRWEIIKNAIGTPAFFLMNLTFISFMQNFLLVAITTPAYLFLVIARNFPESKESFTSDIVFSRGMMLAIFLEFFADQQQWNFHQAKSNYKKTGKVPAGWDKAELERGFIHSGLWAFSRHPNFVGEQMIWVFMYQWSAMVTDSLYNWTGVGALSYCLLFQGSTWLTELITAGKYPDYKVYQKHVSMFLPRVQSIQEGGFYFPEQDASKNK